MLAASAHGCGSFCSDKSFPRMPFRSQTPSVLLYPFHVYGSQLDNHLCIDALYMPRLWLMSLSALCVSPAYFRAQNSETDTSLQRIECSQKFSKSCFQINLWKRMKNTKCVPCWNDINRLNKTKCNGVSWEGGSKKFFLSKLSQCCAPPILKQAGKDTPSLR